MGKMKYRIVLAISLILGFINVQADEYSIVAKGSKYGIQQNGKWTTKPAYLEITRFGESFFVLTKKGKYAWGDKWMLISPEGIDLRGESGSSPIILTESRAIFCGKLIDNEGKVLYEREKSYLSVIDKCYGEDEFGKSEFDKSLLGERIFLQINSYKDGQDYKGVVDINGNEIVSPIYKYADLFYNGKEMLFSVAMKTDNEKWEYKIALYDLEGKEVMPFVYSSRWYVSATGHPDLIKVEVYTSEFICMAIPTREYFLWKGSFSAIHFNIGKEACEIVMSTDTNWSQIAKSHREKYFSKKNAEYYHTYYVDGHFYPLIPRPDPVSLPNPFSNN